MKKLFIISLLLLSILVSAQAPFFSAYNKGKTSPKGLPYGEWINYKGNESFTYELTPVGYKKTLSELENVLKFYGLNVQSEHYDDSLFYEDESIYDIQKIYTNCILKYSSIAKVYRKGYVQILLIVNDQYANIQIRRI